MSRSGIALVVLLVATLGSALASPVRAELSAEELAKLAQNPVELADPGAGAVHVPEIAGAEVTVYQVGDRCVAARSNEFGYASALADIGLPRSDVPLALFAFNVGVELGQLAFIAVVLGLFALAKRIRLAASLERYARPAAPYAIGSLASFWFFERLAGFWA